MTTLVLPVASLCWREVIRFCRQRSRLTGALLQPLVFWILLGAGFSASFHPPGTPDGMAYGQYFYPGIIAMVILFTAIFSTISVVDDRQHGFLQGVLVAPISRATIILGQALGGTTLALAQALLFLVLAPLAGISLTAASIVRVGVVAIVVAFGLVNLGLFIAWRLDSTQGFHAIMNLILLPMWFLSGALFPATKTPIIVEWIMRVNPLTYGVAAIRHSLYLGNPEAAGQVPPLSLSLVVILGFAVVSFIAATWMASRKELP
ncbi:MAG TPA: ABC transporter permease [Methylomirabilota bacterium]|nr:ABC transporter permease [Methylomirabilota bacterium]